jgi:hypothetical protein
MTDTTESPVPVVAIDSKVPDVPKTLAQIQRARDAVQDAVGRGRLLMHMPPRVEIDHDVVIWDALLGAKTTINGLADVLDKAERERDAMLPVVFEAGYDVQERCASDALAEAFVQYRASLPSPESKI